MQRVVGIAMLLGITACAPRGAALWRERSPERGVVEVSLEGSSVWVDASFRRAREEIAAWCAGNPVIDWEGRVDLGAGVQAHGVVREDANGETYNDIVQPVRDERWVIRFHCAGPEAAATVSVAAPVPTPPPAPVERNRATPAAPAPRAGAASTVLQALT